MQDDWAIHFPDAWLDRAFGHIVDALRNNGGSRNVALRAAGYRWGRIRHIANGSAESFDAELARVASSLGLPDKEVRTTLARALRDGQKNKTQHYVATDAPAEASPRIRITRSAINPTDDAPGVDLVTNRETTPEDARAIWRAARDFLGTPAETYLRKRGIPPEAVACDVRYSRSEHFHYVIFSVTDDAGDIHAIQRVSIDADGEPWTRPDGSKRKLTTGTASAGTFRALDADGPLYVCEGPEDALSIAMALMSGGKPGRVSAALTKPTRLLGPDVVYVADNDAGLGEARKAAAEAGALLVAPPDGAKDANDVLRQSGPQTLLALLDGPERPEVIKIETLAALVRRIDALPEKHVVWSRLRTREVAMVFGRSNAGKTNLLNDLFCSAVEPGCALLDEPVTLPDGRPILWLSGEQDAEDWRSRLGGWSSDRIRYAELPQRINVAEPPNWLETAIADHCLVVLDTALTGLVYQDARATESVGSALLWNALHERVKPMVRRHNSLLILSHHAPKNSDTGNTPYGDMAENSMDQVLQIRRASGKEVAEGGPYEGATGIAEWYKVRGNTFAPKEYFAMHREVDMSRPGMEGRLRCIRVSKKA